MNSINTNVQSVFNEIKGRIIEIDRGELFSNITLAVGNHNNRKVNLVCKTILYNTLVHDKFNINDKVKVRFFLSSSKKHDRWYTNANILEIIKADY